MASPTLHVTVRSRQGVVYEGDLAVVSSVNKSGPFDVMPNHTNFVCMISKHVVLRSLDNKVQEINVENGVLMVEKNTVKVFLGVNRV
jgi:F0F1-type ATP synthase epsilon subunit